MHSGPEGRKNKRKKLIFCSKYKSSAYVENELDYFVFEEEFKFFFLNIQWFHLDVINDVI